MGHYLHQVAPPTYQIFVLPISQRLLESGTWNLAQTTPKGTKQKWLQFGHQVASPRPCLPWLYIVWCSCILSNMTLLWLLYVWNNCTLFYEWCMSDMTVYDRPLTVVCLIILYMPSMTAVCLTWLSSDCGMSDNIIFAYYDCCMSDNTVHDNDDPTMRVLCLTRMHRTLLWLLYVWHDCPLFDITMLWLLYVSRYFTWSSYDHCLYAWLECTSSYMSLLWLLFVWHDCMFSYMTLILLPNVYHDYIYIVLYDPNMTTVCFT